MKNIVKAKENVVEILHSMAKNSIITSYFSTYLKEKYDMPPSVTQNFLFEPKDAIMILNDNPYDVGLLFQIIDALSATADKKQTQPIRLTTYFSEQEIYNYKNRKYTKSEKSIYPFEIQTLAKINEDQWVAVIDAKVLSNMNDLQLIRYNKNTQRNLTEKNGEFQITLKEKSVTEIHNLMKQKLFISNALTLNLNFDDPETDFVYDEQSNKIILTNGKLDIIDGYHRFRAMMKGIALDENFNQKMVAYITNFDEAKAKRYIVQEDKRNKIDVRHIKSIDDTKAVNVIINRLNEDPSSCLYCRIGREDETDKISLQQFSQWMSRYYKIQNRADIFKISKKMKNVFNTLVENGVDIGNIGFLELGVIIAATKEDNAIYVDENMIKEASEYNVKRKIVNKKYADIVDNIVNGK